MELGLVLELALVWVAIDVAIVLMGMRAGRLRVALEAEAFPGTARVLAFDPSRRAALRRRRLARDSAASAVPARKPGWASDWRRAHESGQTARR